MLHTLIIGGGIAGATALHRLASAGCDVVLLEARDTLGGVIRSKRGSHGGLIELGPNTMQISNDAVVRLIDELGLENDLLAAAPEAKNRYIVRDGKLVPLPRGPGSFLSTSALSFGGKLRLLKEPFVGKGSGEESVAQFIERRLGREVLDYAVDPFISGIYAGRTDRLSIHHALSMLHTMEQQHGSLLRGARAMKRARGGKPRSGRRGLFSFRDGMQSLPRAIERKWERHVRLGTPVERIRKIDGGWKVKAMGERWEAENIIIATEADTAAGLLAEIDGELAGVLNAIEYPPLATVYSLYKRDDVSHPLDGFGMLAPAVEGRRILGTIFSSTLFPGRAPAGLVALSTFVGGARQPEIAKLPEEEIAAIVERELAELLGISAAPRSAEVHVWPRAIPQFNLGYGAVLDAIDAAEKRHAGLRLLGNYRGKAGVPDVIAMADEAVSNWRDV